MLSVILRWLGTFLGGPFATAAVNAYKAKLAAGNNAEKISADLAAEEAEINAQRDALNAQIIVAEQGRWYTAVVRPLFAMPFLIYNFKVIVWDKVFGWGSTDPLSNQLLQVESITLAGYFGSIALENSMRVFRLHAK